MKSCLIFSSWLMDETKGEDGTDRSLTLRILANCNKLCNCPYLFNGECFVPNSLNLNRLVDIVRAFFYLATFPMYIQPLQEGVFPFITIPHCQWLNRDGSLIATGVFIITSLVKWSAGFFCKYYMRKVRRHAICVYHPPLSPPFPPATPCHILL